MGGAGAVVDLEWVVGARARAGEDLPGSLSESFLGRMVWLLAGFRPPAPDPSPDHPSDDVALEPEPCPISGSPLPLEPEDDSVPDSPLLLEVEDGSTSGPVLPFALGDRLAAAVPGPALAGELAGLDPADLGRDVDALIEAIAAWERVTSWAAAAQAVLLRALQDHEDRCGRGEFAADAVATRLHITRQAARAILDRAQLLGAHPSVSDALETGRLDAHKATTVVETLAEAPPGQARTILDTLLPGAPDVTAPTLRARIRAAIATLDPTGAQARAECEAARRRVTLTPTGDAMAYLTFYLPADQAITCLTAIEAIAAAARTPQDTRTPHARRVDALTDVLRAILDTGRTPTGIALPTQQHRHPHIQVTLAATTLLGLDDAPGELAGYGPIPATMARRIAADGTWRRLLLDPATGQVTARDATTYRPGADLTGTIIARDRTCTFPGCRVPAWHCDLDHLNPYQPDTDPATQTTPDNLHPLCRHHHRLKTHTTWTVRRDPTGTTTWTTPWHRHYTHQPEPLPGAPAPPGQRGEDHGPPPF